MNFAYLLLDNINKYGEYMLLNYEDQEYTNTDLERLSNRLGRGLLKMGLQKDDRIVVFLPNIPEVLISYLAILKVGAI
ncbi:MAG: AMP-binding protein, partial [Dethiobacteria bacterium]